MSYIQTVTQQTYRVVTNRMKNLQAKASLERCRATKFEKMQETLYVVKEAVSVTYSYKDLTGMLEPSFLEVLVSLPRRG
jgi:hypothetical protein